MEREAKPSQRRADASPAAECTPSATPESPGVARNDASSKVREAVHGSPRVVAQRRQIENTFGTAAQLPDPLKTGIESLSGMSMDPVKVHYNSPEPAELNAHAYTRGTDIHVAPGQERHLPHEAWHVVQQAQGRVQATTQMKGDVQVNDDEELEKEADEMGTQAMSVGRSALASPNEPVNQLAAGHPVFQRRIHEWKDGQWIPGAKFKEGTKKFPKKVVKRKFFNDMTGKRGTTAAEAAETLTELSLKKGTLHGLQLPSALAGQTVDGGTTLQGLDDMLTDWFKATHESGKGHVAELGYFSFSKDQEDWVWHKGNDPYDLAHWKDAVKDFLRNFMVATGQMDYIRSRDWYINKTHMVEIDVNYYINREFGDIPVSIHKDTGGANLFVNLIFTNKAPTIGTEVTIDTRRMGALKKKSLLLHMPQQQVQDIETARAGLKQTSPLASKIESSELPAYGYVSWVDELIWHSSPFIGNRPKWSKSTAQEVMTKFTNDATKPMTHEAMILIARNKDSNLRKRMAKEKKTTLTYVLAVKLWNAGYHLGDVKSGAEVAADIDLIKWPRHKVSEAVGEDQDARDPRVEKQQGIRTPSGLIGRPRTLSDAEEQKKWKLLQEQKASEGSEKGEASGSTEAEIETKAKAVEAEKNAAESKAITKAGRNFLRTWVRMKEIKRNVEARAPHSVNRP